MGACLILIVDGPFYIAFSRLSEIVLLVFYSFQYSYKARLALATFAQSVAVGLSSFLLGLLEGRLGAGCLGVIAPPQSRQYNPCVKRPTPVKNKSPSGSNHPGGTPP